MNSINPQSTSIVQHYSRGREPPEAIAKPEEEGGKTLPETSAKTAQAAENVDKTAQKREQLSDTVAKLNDYIQNVQRDLLFSLDESSGESVISVVDRHSSEVIRQIPAEITLLLAQKLSNEEPLLLFSARV